MAVGGAGILAVAAVSLLLLRGGRTEGAERLPGAAISDQRNGTSEGDVGNALLNSVTGEPAGGTAAGLGATPGGGQPGAAGTPAGGGQAGAAGTPAGGGQPGAAGTPVGGGQAGAAGTPVGGGQAGAAGPAKKQPPEGFELVFASEDWGLSFGEPGAQSVGNASAEDLAWYDAYYVGDDSEKIIYLTFDCGYENGNTEPILDALQKHGVPATFFVVGHFLETAPELVKRMVEEGHTVGNHTYHHPDMSSISDYDSFRKELDDVAALFHEVTGEELSPYYRPPQGKCNAQNVKMAQEAGYFTIFWSLAYVDWDTEKQPSHDSALEKLTARIHPGAVVLLHNTSRTNGEILDQLLTKWEEMGYIFKPLSDLTGNVVSAAD